MLSGIFSPTDVARRMLDETLLVRAVAAIEQEFSEQPLIEAALRQTVGEVYGGLGLFPSALDQLERAAPYVIRDRELGSNHRDTLRARAALGLLLLNTDQVEQAREHLEASLVGIPGTGRSGRLRTP